MKSRQEIKKQAKELIAENDLWITMGLPYLIISAIDTLSYFGNRESGLSSALAILQIVYQLCASLYVKRRVKLLKSSSLIYLEV